ncbi:secreted RxLR effector protein 161-like [Tasmannia lanceolata]|uniref:secreted RxLR effector protein 161-like n=1 Tax=Tasmannia lanceolata TaxID=3420 RepID=UPI00406462E1
MYSKTSKEKQERNGIPCASVVGSRMYAMLCTRPDVYFVVSVVSRYQSDPGPEHWTAVKHIFKYLRRTKHYFLIYGGDELVIFEFTDAKFQSDVDNIKSSSSFVFTLASGAVSWRSCNGVIAQAKEPRSHQKSKHVIQKYHVIREIIDRGDVAIVKVALLDDQVP